MISRFRQYVRAHGVRASARRLFVQLRQRVYSNAPITPLLKDLDSIKEPAKRSGVRIEPLDRDRLGGLYELNRKRHRRRADRRFRKQLDRGLHGFVGLRDGETVAYYWWVEGERGASHPDLEWLMPALEIRPGDVYGSDFYVLPEHRQGGTANELLFMIETALKDRGFKRIWGYVDAGNSGARWLYSSRGYESIGEVTVRKLFSRRRTGPVSQ
jgi:GNAT superfamily N-acetyltransferase